MEYLLIKLEGAFLFDDKFGLKNKILFKNENYDVLKQIQNNSYDFDKIKSKLNSKNAIVLNEANKFILSDTVPKEFEDIVKNFKNIMIECETKISDILKQSDYIEVSQSQIKDSFTKDNLIIQVFNNIDEMKRSFNLFSKRLREYYELTGPEISKMFSDSKEFTELIINNAREELFKKYNIKKTSGVDFDKADYKIVLNIAKQNLSLIKFIEQQEKYLEELLNSYAPNLIAIAGTTVSAQLISHVGSLKKLAFLPSSTIQILGAEKSLFRHLRGNGRCPKHGYLFNNAMVQSSSNKGKMARQLACKISICARVDLNHGNFIADKLIKEIK